MTAQEVFETSATGLLKQNQKSVDEAKSYIRCMYRGANNSKCAVGFLLTDVEVTDEVEKAGTAYQLHDNGLLPSRLIPHIELLGDLQLIHDNTEPFRWKSLLLDLGTKLKLDTTFITDYKQTSERK